MKKLLTPLILGCLHMLTVPAQIPEAVKYDESYINFSKEIRNQKIAKYSVDYKDTKSIYYKNVRFLSSGQGQALASRFDENPGGTSLSKDRENIIPIKSLSPGGKALIKFVYDAKTGIWTILYQDLYKRQRTLPEGRYFYLTKK